MYFNSCEIDTCVLQIGTIVSTCLIIVWFNIQQVLDPSTWFIENQYRQYLVELLVLLVPRLIRTEPIFGIQKKNSPSSVHSNPIQHKYYMSYYPPMKESFSSFLPSGDDDNHTYIGQDSPYFARYDEANTSIYRTYMSNIELESARVPHTVLIFDGPGKV